MIKKLSLLLLLIFVQNFYGQSKPEFFSKDFQWKISIPDNFESVSSEEWRQFQNKGKVAIEDTFDQEIENLSKTIFIFKSEGMNYFESNYQPFDPKVDGNFIETFNGVADVLYITFKDQMPEIKIDTTKTVEKIDGLEFQVLDLKVEYPNKMVLYTRMYSRLFGKREFTVNIIYLDQKKGTAMLDSWRNSKFSRAKQ